MPHRLNVLCPQNNTETEVEVRHEQQKLQDEFMQKRSAQQHLTPTTGVLTLSSPRKMAFFLFRLESHTGVVFYIYIPQFWPCSSADVLAPIVLQKRSRINC